MATLGSTTYDALIAGPQSRLITDSVLIEKGQALKRGSLLGKYDGRYLFALCDATKTNGLESFFAILGEDVDTTDGKDKLAFVYYEGDFNTKALITREGENPEQYRWKARVCNAYFRNIVTNK